MSSEQPVQPDDTTGKSDMLSRLLDPGFAEQREWRKEELGAILRHSISEPVQFDLGRLPSGTSGKLQAIVSEEGLILKNLTDLFAHPHPPIELLVMVKDFAKAHHESAESSLPEEVATVVYLASIAVAMLRWNERITTQSDASLCKSLRWAIGLPWQEAGLQSLFTETLARLEGSRKDTVP